MVAAGKGKRHAMGQVWAVPETGQLPLGAKSCCGDDPHWLMVGWRCGAVSQQEEGETPHFKSLSVLPTMVANTPVITCGTSQALFPWQVCTVVFTRWQ